MTEIDHVVLLDEAGRAIGTAPKSSVHGSDTALHLAFSCHVVNDAGEVLVTRRALTKKTWPGVWTNSFCGHPMPDEAIEDAVRGRAEAELGIRISDIEPMLPDFRYRATDASGIVEYEICPVFRAETMDAVRPAPAEVSEFAWVELPDLRTAVNAAPYAFSPWLGLQLAELA